MATIDIEVDGKHIESADVNGQFCGAVYGETRVSQNGLVVTRPTTCLWQLEYWDNQEERGIRGLFKNGEWTRNSQGSPMYRVWDRII